MSAAGVELTVNGERHRLGDLPGEERLLDTLRWRLGLKGTKEGCRTGGCGACTVLLEGRATLSCLTLSGEADGREITTVEGIERHPFGPRVVAAFAAEPGLQCGYCTPGFVVAAAGALGERPNATAEELAEALAGNLCRCTGYASIRRALRAVTEGR